LHIPGLLLLVRMQRAEFPKSFVTGVVFASGYLDTVLLMLVGILGFRWWVRRLNGKHSVSQE
jgi:hypothetical protein